MIAATRIALRACVRLVHKPCWTSTTSARCLGALVIFVSVQAEVRFAVGTTGPAPVGHRLDTSALRSTLHPPPDLLRWEND